MRFYDLLATRYNSSPSYVLGTVCCAITSGMSHYFHVHADGFTYHITHYSLLMQYSIDFFALRLS